MPDDQDYAELDRLLASASDWTEREAAYMRSLERSQTEIVDQCHPKDLRRRQTLEGLVERIRTAITSYERSRG